MANSALSLLFRVDGLGFRVLGLQALGSGFSDYLRTRTA